MDKQSMATQQSHETMEYTGGKSSGLETQKDMEAQPSQEMNENAAGKGAAMDLLTEMVLDYMGIPLPHTAGYVRQLQDELLPAFVASARLAWLVSAPYPTHDAPTLERLRMALQDNSTQLLELNDLLGGLGVHALLQAVATSSAAPYIADLPIAAYETRVLRAANPQRTEAAVRAYLHYAARNPQVLSDSEGLLAEASEQTHAAYFGDAGHPPGAGVAAPVSAGSPPASARASRGIQKIRSAPASANTPGSAPNPQPKRRTMTGIFKMLEGALLLAADGCIVPTIPTFAVTALPVLASFAAGVGAVGQGIGDMRGE